MTFWPKRAPSADEIARALVYAADETGERGVLRRLETGAQLRNQPLKCRTVAFHAIMRRRDPHAYPPWEARVRRAMGLEPGPPSCLARASDSRAILRVAASL